jgi:hypothetical protein
MAVMLVIYLQHDGTLHPPTHQTARNKMKRPAGWIPFALYGLSATAALAELHSRLQVVYAQLSAFSVTQDTGLLNNLLRLLGNVVAPLSDVLQTVRSILIGVDGVPVLERLAIAQALVRKTTYFAY